MKNLKLAIILFNIFSIVTVMCFVFVVVMLVTGTEMYAVATDSMSPYLKEGDAVVVLPVDVSEIKEGDVITVAFSDNSGYFTHRVTRIDNENDWVYTKGDANALEDPFPSSLKYIQGRMLFSIPAIGFISLAIGRRLLLGILAMAAILLFIIRVVAESITKSKNKAKG